MAATNYDCTSCPAYCCAYPLIPATGNDIKRLAKHLGKTINETRESFTVLESPRRRGLKMTADNHLTDKSGKHPTTVKSCVFLDKRTRDCTVYAGRPEICRDHPGDRCEWHDRRMIETAMANSRGSRRKVIFLRKMPWTIDADYPLYDLEHVSDLLESYAKASPRDRP